MKIKIVQNLTKGLKIAKFFLYKYVDRKTVLFLSGGTTPKPLYETLAKEKKLRPGGVALVDERFGLSNHENSNEKMLRDTGLLSYFEGKKIPFYSILRLPSKSVASDIVVKYDKEVNSLLSEFPKKVAIMGIGKDGHTAGLPPGIKNSKLKIQNYVMEIRNFHGEFKKRITLTFNALSKMDLLIVLVFGSAKENALKLMFTQGLVEEIPARFYTQPEIAEKTILITDQKV